MRNSVYHKIISAISLLGVLSACAGNPDLSATASEEAVNSTGNSAAPVVNAHMHAAYLGMDDADYLADVLTEMNANNIDIAVLHINEPSDIEDWLMAAPGKFLAGPSFPCFETGRDNQPSCSWDDGNWPSISWLRRHYERGTLSIMGELLLVYAGIAPSDPKMEDYWALAAELDIPVAVHTNRGPPPDSPSRPSGCCPNFNADLGNPALLRPVLTKFPQLRIYLQHAGFPPSPEFDGIAYLDETFALLADYPNVYVDMTALNSVPPPFVHETAVKQFLERGFIDRLMMGTDNWEAAPIIARYRSFEFLTPEQKRGILYENAARFFGLDTDK